MFIWSVRSSKVALRCSISAVASDMFWKAVRILAVWDATVSSMLWMTTCSSARCCISKWSSGFGLVSFLLRKVKADFGRSMHVFINCFRFTQVVMITQTTVPRMLIPTNVNIPGTA